jgi:hypothetical protein
LAVYLKWQPSERMRAARNGSSVITDARCKLTPQNGAL